MPYDAPAQDLAAALYAARPDAGLFELTAGTIGVMDDGGMQFTASAEGKHKRVTVDAGKRDQVLAAMRELVTAKPVAPPPRRRLTPEEQEKLRLERLEEIRKREEEQRKARAVKP
jgi:hypothetical protein